jgi:chromosome segregation protein
MQLSKLEIRGFKSFGDKVLIHFDKGITGIVGPNGCGKSNVVDAIRWVLGEQKTRMLRSDKMENVIFNGTKNRKQLNMAEVSLTFENTKNLLPTEYTHVTITRRYYRSGDSEYLLNGITCRLKDITNLFMDTGINSNSYAIIELKMIDELLNDKNNSRRDLFEEAAGISKFKTRKKETLKKLGDTDADLDRVEDLLFEIEKNLKSLEKQAKQATRYFEIKKDYKSASIALAKRGVFDQREALIKLNERLEKENDQKLQLNANLARKDAILENLKTQMVNKEKLLGSRQKTLNEHVLKIRQFESDKKIKNERLRFLQDKSDQLREQIEQDKKSNERAAFSIKSLEQEQRITEKLTNEKEQKVLELKAVYEEKKVLHNASREKQKVMQSTFARKRDELYQLSKNQEIKQIQLTTIRQELEKTATDDNSQIENLAGFEEKLQEVQIELEKENKAFEIIKSEERSHQEKLEEANRMHDLIREEMTQINRRLDAKSNEYQLTKSLVDNLEGFPEAIKFLKKNSQWGNNKPLLSDILTTDEKYRVTIENFLENYMNYYVVDNDKEAIDAVKLLSDAGKGKANFFVLERFAKFRASQNKLFPDALAATEIIEYDSKYAPLVAYLLDDVYIFSGDIHQVPKTQEGIFITESGKFIDRRFTISGGSVGLFEGKRIGRAKNLEKLEKEIKVLKNKINEVSSNLDKKTAELSGLKAISFKEAIEEKQVCVNELNQDYVSLKTKKEQLAEMLTSNANKKEDIEEKIFLLTEELEKIAPQLTQEKEAYESLEKEINVINLDLQDASEELSYKSSQYNEENILYHQQLNKLQSIEQEISFKQSTYSSSKERIEKAQAEMGQTEQEIKSLIDNNEIKDDELIELYGEKEHIESGVNEAERDYYASRGEIDETEKAIREIQRRKEQSDNLLMDLKQAANEINLRLNGIKERLSVEFELDLDQIIQENPELAGEHASKTEDTLREEVQKAKAKLERMGPINPMAMEAYDEIKERHTFITAQKEDLIKAKESLMTTIKEIDQVAKETFIDAFEKIKANFVKVFRSLFTEEDDCDLRLTDPDMPLESSIEIIAKPKGKRPLSINQLSGGEKTLTATSLLFSIYLLKPAPFCIFDEVDAPLDDANIDKFNQIIQKFSNESQFIIVTHNKRTMASTDIIYGITMIEAGVSRVVPVDLRELVDEEEGASLE